MSWSGERGRCWRCWSWSSLSLPGKARSRASGCCCELRELIGKRVTAGAQDFEEGVWRWGGCHAWKNYREEFSLAFLVAARTQASAAALCFRPSPSDSSAGARGTSLPRASVFLADRTCISTFSPLPELTPRPPYLTHLGGLAPGGRSRVRMKKA